MGYTKKIGVILMVGSMLAAIWLFFISDCDICGPFSSLSLMTQLTHEHGYRLQLLEDAVVIPYKYVLLSCLTVFTVGLLFFLETINAPYQRKLDKFLGGPVKSHDEPSC